MTSLGQGLSVFVPGQDQGGSLNSSIKIIVVDTENADALEKLSSYLADIKNKSGISIFIINK